LEGEAVITITLTDARNRTICKFVKERPDSEWFVSDRLYGVQPYSLPAHLAPSTRTGDLPSAHLLRLPEGRDVLEVPGLTLRWEKLPAILDRLAEHDIRRLTVAQLRACVDSRW
jgi:hypothetical protein